MQKTDDSITNNQNDSITNNQNDSSTNNQNDSITNNQNDSSTNNQNDSSTNNENDLITNNKSPINPFVEKSRNLANDLIVFYNREMDENGSSFIDPLPRETIEYLMIKGLNTGIINMNTTSQEIIKVLKANYSGPWFLPKGVRNHNEDDQKKILNAYYWAFAMAKLKGHV